jgi:F-type H+-transporting ATPase subunit b
MEQISQALAGILLKSIPTIVLLVFLYFYLKAMLFGPLDRLLTHREELTAGTRNAAEKSLRDAEHKVEDYEAKMREARAEVYREQEEIRRRWLTDQAAQVTTAREKTGGVVQAAKAQITEEVASARQSLAASAGTLADQIASAVLARKG